MKQEKIANLVGRSQSLISQVLNGNRSVSKNLAIKFSEIFGGDIGFWIGATPEQIRSALSENSEEQAENVGAEAGAS